MHPVMPWMGGEERCLSGSRVRPLGLPSPAAHREDNRRHRKPEPPTLRRPAVRRPQRRRRHDRERPLRDAAATLKEVVGVEEETHRVPHERRTNDRAYDGNRDADEADCVRIGCRRGEWVAHSRPLAFAT